MQKKKHILIILLFLLGISCFPVPKKPVKEIEYPETGSFGSNLLKLNSASRTIQPDTVYSLHFNIIGDKIVRFVIMDSIPWSHVIDPPPIGFLQNPIKLARGLGIFSSQQKGMYDIGITFSSGTATTTQIKIYESLSNDPTRIITLQMGDKK